MNRRAALTMSNKIKITSNTLSPGLVPHHSFVAAAAAVPHPASKSKGSSTRTPPPLLPSTASSPPPPLPAIALPLVVVMSRRGFPPVAPPAAAVLVALLLVAAAAGGVRGLRGGTAAQPRKLAVGGSGGDSPRRRAAELVKESSHASAMAEAGIPPLQLILAEEGRAEGTVCLDGSAPGFYYRKGYGSGHNNWVLFYEGGAWCASPHACLRVQGAHAPGGMLSGNKTVNPGFYNWNAVYFISCDGGSFSGHQNEQVHFNGILLYMRGRRVAELLVKHLMGKKGLGHVEKNPTISLPPACVKERSLEQHHQCFMANHILQYVSTPLFLVNSNYDKVAMRAITAPEVLDSGLTAPPDCFDHLSTCTAKEKHIFEDYRKAVANAVAPLFPPHSTPENAVFLFSCFQHGSIHSDVPWMMRTAKGVIPNPDDEMTLVDEELQLDGEELHLDELPAIPLAPSPAADEPPAAKKVCRKQRLNNKVQISVAQLQQTNGQILGARPAPDAFRKDPGLLYIGLDVEVEPWTCVLCNFACGPALDSAMAHMASEAHTANLRASAKGPAAKIKYSNWRALTFVAIPQIAAFLSE
ncbi:unnamed protein product [Closterium sp. Yama58-4]|nr:unnamed protein product [Closterium sp. Yama58-4]